MISASVAVAIEPDDRRTDLRAASPSAGLPMASDFAIVSGRTGVGTDFAFDQGPGDRGATGRLRAGDPHPLVACDEPDESELGETLVDLGEETPRGDRHDDVVRESPAELLGHLEGERLGALGVVGAEVDVDERPFLVFVDDLGAEAVDLVVGAVDGDDPPPNTAVVVIFVRSRSVGTKT